MSLRLLYLIFVRLCGWLVLLGRPAASKNAEPRSPREPRWPPIGLAAWAA